MSGSALLFSNFGIHIIYFEEIPMYYEWNRWKMKWSMCLGTQTTWWNYTLARMGTHVALLHTIFPSFNRTCVESLLLASPSPSPQLYIYISILIHVGVSIHQARCTPAPSHILPTYLFYNHKPSTLTNTHPTQSPSLSLLVQLTSLFSLLAQYLSSSFYSQLISLC